MIANIGMPKRSININLQEKSYVKIIVQYYTHNVCIYDIIKITHTTINI